MPPTRPRPFARLLLFAMFSLFYLPALVMLALPGARHLPGRVGTMLAKTLEGHVLWGMTTQATVTPLSARDWLDGTFQDTATQWVNANFGLRHYFIGAANQIDYSVFHMSRMNNNTIVVGKNNVLYERPYIDDYCHLKPLYPLNQMQAQIEQVAELRRRLNRRGIAFVVLITPDKAASYPEYIPAPFSRLPMGGRRNYNNLVECLRRSDVPYVDGHEITLDDKRAANTPVFPRGGTHWNLLCAYQTVRQLVSVMERESGRTLPHLTVKAAPVSHLAYLDQDVDLVRLTNVLFPDTHYPVPQPVFAVEPAGVPLRKAIFVGGSFLGTPVDMLTKNGVIGQIDYYFYYRRWLQRAPDTAQRPVDVTKINWERDVFDAPVIVLEINESVPGIGPDSHFGAFTSDALKHLQP